jgi:hypothetical protein
MRFEVAKATIACWAAPAPTCSTEATDDQIFGEEGSDLIYGGDGVDDIGGGEGSDLIHGGFRPG